MEVWKDIKGYEGLYQISSLGRVKSLERKIIRKNNSTMIQKEVIMKFSKRSGYYTVRLKRKNDRKNYQVHRLVANTFLSNPTRLPQVNHKDGNKLNNNLENLEWVSCKQNINHAFKTRLISSIRHNNRPVIQYDTNMNFIREYISLCEAEKTTGISHSNISKCCRGIYKQANNFIWKYKE